MLSSFRLPVCGNWSTACVCVCVDVVVRWWGGSRVSKAFLPPELLPLATPPLSRLANSGHASFPLASSGPLWLAQREELAYSWAVTGLSWPSVSHNPAPNKCCSAPCWRSEERRAPLLETRCNYHYSCAGWSPNHQRNEGIYNKTFQNMDYNWSRKQNEKTNPSKNQQKKLARVSFFNAEKSSLLQLFPSCEEGDDMKVWRIWNFKYIFMSYATCRCFSRNLRG